MVLKQTTWPQTQMFSFLAPFRNQFLTHTCFLCLNFERASLDPLVHPTVSQPLLPVMSLPCSFLILTGQLASGWGGWLGGVLETETSPSLDPDACSALQVSWEWSHT